MTPDERLDRIEHLTAALAEERRKDRDEYKTLWRDTQRQINENSAAIARNTLALADTREFLQQLAERLDQHAAASHAADERLGERIASLVSAIGQHISQGH
jgi:phosphoenolpyruvate-protein kinase (PTS system EI component)